MPTEQNNISAQTDSQSPQAPQDHQTSAEVVIEVNQQETLQRRAGQMLLRPENRFPRQLARNLIFSSFATATALVSGNISCLTTKDKTCHQFISGVSVGLGLLVFAGAGLVTACKSRSTSVAPISKLIESAPEIFPTLQTGTGADMNRGSGNIDLDSQAARPSPRPLTSGVASTQTAGSNQTSMSQII